MNLLKRHHFDLQDKYCFFDYGDGSGDGWGNDSGGTGHGRGSYSGCELGSCTFIVGKNSPGAGNVNGNGSGYT